MSSNGLLPKPQVALDEAIDFRSLLHTFWEKKLIIGMVTALFVIIAGVYTYLKPLEYQANALLQVESQQNSQFSMLSQQLGTGNKETSATARQIALIRSRFILEPVVKQLDLATSIKRRETPLIGRFFNRSDETVKIDSLTVPPQYQNKSLSLVVMDKSHYHLLNDEQEVIVQGVVGKLVDQNGVSIYVSEITAKPGADFEVIKRTNSSVVSSLLGRIQIEEIGDDNNTQTGILSVSLTSGDPVSLVIILNAIVEVARAKDAERKSLESATLLQFLNQQLPIVKKIFTPS